MSTLNWQTTPRPADKTQERVQAPADNSSGRGRRNWRDPKFSDYTKFGFGLEFKK